MIQAKCYRERVPGYGLALGFEFARVIVPHPYTGEVKFQPTVTIMARFMRWVFYFVVLNEVRHKLNRKQRRANKKIIKFK